MNEKNFLNIIKDISIQLKLTTTQSIFIFALYNENYGFDISTQELLELIDKQFILKNSLTTKTTEFLDNLVKNNYNKDQNVEKILRQTASPNLNLDTIEICRNLGKHFIGTNGITSKWVTKYLEYTNNNLIKVPFLWMFTQMFPTRGEENADWNRHFEVQWGSIQLRRVTNGWLRKFNEIFIKRDIGLFLLGTYLYIKSCYSEKNNQYYIKTIENYMSSEWEYWYSEAERQLDGGELKRLTTNFKISQSNNFTVAI